MEHFQRIISSLDKEDVRYFKLFTSRYQKENRKDLALFDYTRSHPEGYADEAAFKRLYKQGDKNAFYRLKNKLTEDIGFSLICRHTPAHPVMLVCHLLQLAYWFSQKNIPETAYYYLKKAEKICIREELFEALDIIYTEIIRLSHEYGIADPFKYLKVRTTNAEKINQLRKVDDLLVIVKHKLKTSQNYAADGLSVFETLQKEIDAMKFSVFVRNSIKFKTHIYEALSKMLLAQQSYAELEQFTLKTYKSFLKQNLFSRENHELKLKMLTYLVNSSFKSQRFSASLDYTAQLYEAMQEFQQAFFDKYYFFYINSQVINYSHSDKPRAIVLLEDLKNDVRMKAVGFYEIFIYINLTVLYYDTQVYKQAAKQISVLKRMPAFENADESLKLKIAISEMMLRIEMKDYDLLSSLHKQTAKIFSAMLRTKAYEREKSMMHIIKIFMKAATPANVKEAENTARFLSGTSKENASDILFYNDWIEKALPRYRKGTLFLNG